MTDKEVDHLDIILNKICKSNSSVYYKFLQDENGYPLGIKDDEEAQKYFIKLSLEFETIGIAYYDNPSSVLAPVKNECIKFENNGGFKVYYKNLKQSIIENKKLSESEKERQVTKDKIDKLTLGNLEYEKTIRFLKEELMISSLLKNYWWLIGSAIVLGATIGAYLF